MDDFNGHNTLWGYSDTNEDGERFIQWANADNVFLIDVPLSKMEERL